MRNEIQTSKIHSPFPQEHKELNQFSASMEQHWLNSGCIVAVGFSDFFFFLRTEDCYIRNVESAVLPD